MDLRRSFSVCCLLVALGACSGSSGGGSSLPTLTNLGISALALHGQGELWALEVAEAGEGAADRNGDGDALDVVLSVYDLAADSRADLGLAPGGFPLVAVGDVLVAFGVSEADQGNTDLNGDGDAGDLVLHVHDVRDGVTTNTALAMAGLQPAVGAGAAAFAVQESAQGNQDLDGDGTTNGFVLHVYDARTTLTTNAQRNVTSDLVFHDHAFGFTTDEASAGTDLNGDGDQLDTRVFEMFDLPLGGLEMVPLAIRGRALAVNADDWFLLADEGEMGLDLNGDGDTDEAVLHEVHPHQHTQQSIGVSSTGSFGSIVDGPDLGLVAQEADGLDGNGDGDTFDWLVVLHSTALAQTFEPGLAIEPTSALAFVAGRLGFLVHELAQDEDRNADGDLDDTVVHTLDRLTGLAVNLGLDAVSLQGWGSRLVFARPEPAGLQDWNGDGDQDDQVLFCWDSLLGSTISTGIASAGEAAALAGDSILMVVPEASEQDDLNDDGDTDDLVYVLHDLGTHVNTSLCVAVTTPGAGLTEDGRGVLLVSEDGQGADLNGDGDMLDSVLHRLLVP